MALESLLVPAATGTVGLALGFGAALLAKHKGHQMPPEVKKDVWDHLRDLTRERAEAMAKKKALKRAYSAGSITEASFVSKDAHYTKLVEDYDQEIDNTVEELSKAFLPEELAKGEKSLQELSDLAVLSKQLEELKQDKNQLEEEKNELYLQFTELEEDKNLQLIEKNRLREKYDTDSKKLKEMTGSITELEKHRSELEQKVSGIKPMDTKITILEKENRRLRESLDNARNKIFTSDKSLGVLTAIVEKHSHSIDQGKKEDELRELIEPGNPGVKELARKHSSPRQAFNYVRDKLVEVHPKISGSYWLDVDDIMRLNAGDPHDKAVLLCSMIRAMNKEAYVLVVELKNTYKRAVVLTGDHLLDPYETREFDDFSGLSEDEALKKYVFDGFPIKKILYRFNEELYREG